MVEVLQEESVGRQAVNESKHEFLLSSKFALILAETWPDPRPKRLRQRRHADFTWLFDVVGERRDDLVPLAQHFLEQTAAEFGRDAYKLTRTQAEAIENYVGGLPGVVVMSSAISTQG